MASINERTGKKGTSYQLCWRDPDSGKQERWTHATRKEAETWQRLLDSNGQSINAAKSVRKRTEDNPDGITLGQAFEEHLAQLTDVGPYQMKRYRSAIRDHFADLAELPAASITRTDVAGWVNGMKRKPGRYGKPMRSKTIANHHGLLSATFQTAAINHPEQIPGNPCKGIKLPKDTDTEEPMRFLTHDEWARVFAATDPHFRPFLGLLIGTGLRFSEATALTAKDFHLKVKTPYVNVSKAWKEDDDHNWYIGPPKTKKGRRRVTLAPSTIALVTPALENADDGLVFRTKRGGPIRSSPFYHGTWAKALTACGYRKTTKDTEGNMPRIHDIRHSHASWMIEEGMDIFGLSHRLGHESVKTTMDRYSHLLPDAQFKAAEVAERALAARAPAELEEPAPPEDDD